MDDSASAEVGDADTSTANEEEDVQLRTANSEFECALPLTPPEVIDDSVVPIEENVVCESHYSYSFDVQPILLTGCSSEFSPADNFTKGCKWSPDGLCVLTNSDDNCLRLFDLPVPLYSAASSQSTDWTDLSLPDLESVLKVREGETVYDYCWYPLMTSTNPVTCCFVTTTRRNPVHMWDAFTGELRCTYRAYDQVDELVTATSVAFSCNGEKLYCGFNKTIRIFDVVIPGRCCQERSTKAEGQPGIISCIAVNPADEKIYAAGSYLKTIAVYSEPNGSQIFRVEGQVGGVTHLIFSKEGLKLFSGGRKDPDIVCWDLRYPGRILFSMQRQVLTNQRIYFDMIEATGTTLVISGNDDGHVKVWDLNQLTKSNCNGDSPSDEKEVILESVLRFHAHNDCVNGVSFNPHMPIVATSSGQRKFAEPVDDEDSDDFFVKTSTVENSLKLWWAGKK